MQPTLSSLAGAMDIHPRAWFCLFKDRFSEPSTRKREMTAIVAWKSGRPRKPVTADWRITRHGNRFIMTLLVAATVTISTAFSSGRAEDQTPKLVTEHLMVDAADPGIRLYVRNKRRQEMKQFTPER